MELDLVTSGPSGCGGDCGCSADPPEVPRLDVRALPRGVRHAAVLGALDGLAPGSALVLVAPHDPRPLLAEVEQRWPSGFDLGYDRRGPDTWDVRLTRRT